MLFIVMSGILGAGVTFVVLWPYGAFIAFLGAPFGGALFAALAGLWLGWRSAERGQ